MYGPSTNGCGEIMNPDLQQLKDIHLPKAVTTWPIAPGWIILSILLFCIVCYTGYRWYSQRRKKYTAHFALAKLNKLRALMVENPEKINIAAEISILLRRTALHYFQRDEIAGLSGKEWLCFLNRSGDTTHFTSETGYLLTDAPYQKNTLADLTPLFSLAQTWLKTISKNKMVASEK
jgi:hypothetical protein